MNSIRQPFIALVATLLAALPAAGQVPDQLNYTIPDPNPALGNGFGRSVAISGTLVVMGSHWSATDIGSVYVYDLSSAAPTVPVATLNNPSPATGDRFGFSVAISGNRVVVGNHHLDTRGTNAGSAYVYDLSSATPTTSVATLNNPSPDPSPAPDDGFGFSVGISGTRVVVGAPGDDTRGSQIGTTYVYDLSSAVPSTPVVTLNYPGSLPDFNTFFGWAVAIDGPRVVVGESGSGARSYVYDLGSATPAVPVARLRDPEISDIRVSGSVAISGNRVVARAWTRNAENPFWSVYVFDMSSATPSIPVARLVDPNPTTPDREDHFGSSVAISGTRVVVGDSADDTVAPRAGRAYVYDLSGATPATPVATLDNPTPAADARLGDSVAIDGTTVAIGAISSPTFERLVYIFGPAAPPVDDDNDGLLDSWELTYWPTTAGHGPLDDFDQDGIPELLELAFGLNPTISDPAGLPTPIVEGDYLTMIIAKHSGVTYEVQSASTPASFSPATTTVLTDTNTTLKVRDNVLIGSQPARFMRVKITATP